MSLKDRLNATPNNNQPVKKNENNVISNIAPLSEEFSALKEKLHSLLIEKVNSTPSWSNYSDVEQKGLIRQFIEGQLNTNFRSATSSSEPSLGVTVKHPI